MLKVTIVDNEAETKLKVEGILAGDSAAELESAWNRVREADEKRKVLVDLSETTAIDANGKRILMMMASQGAELLARGVYTEYVIKGLVARVHAGCRS